MKDLVSIMGDQSAMIKMGFKMREDDPPKEEKGERYSGLGVCQYTRIVATGGFFKYAPKESNTGVKRNN